MPQHPKNLPSVFSLGARTSFHARCKMSAAVSQRTLRKRWLALIVGLALAALLALSVLRTRRLPSLLRYARMLPKTLERKYHLANASYFTVLAHALESLSELTRAGGVYIYDTGAMLEEAGAPPHFYRSGGPRLDWMEAYDMYTLELSFVRYLQRSPLVTTNAAEAALFFVPQYALHETHFCTWFQPRGGLSECGKNVTREYLQPLLAAVKTTPTWQRRGGLDHIFVFPWDWSWALFPGVPQLLANSSYLGYVDTHKTGNVVVVPAPVQHSWSGRESLRNKLFGGGGLPFFADRLKSPSHVDISVPCKSLPNDKYLASFFGTVHKDRLYSKGIRQDLQELFEGEKGMEARILFKSKHVLPDEYVSALTSSTFCLCPPGWAPWSPRLYSSIAAGCIPVLFQSETPGFFMGLPFSDTLDWASFTVFIPAGRHKELATILNATSPETICSMRGALAELAPFLQWATSPEAVLALTLHDVWERVKEGRIVSG
jgi:hypothetical protein